MQLSFFGICVYIYKKMKLESARAHATHTPRHTLTRREKNNAESLPAITIKEITPLSDIGGSQRWHSPTTSIMHEIRRLNCRGNK